MELEQAVLARRSAIRLTSPAPSDEEILALVELAMTSPDHGRLSPWRLITLRGEARRVLGEAFRMAGGLDQAARERSYAKPLRAPLLITIVFCPKEDSKVPRWEQMAATACVVHTLLLLLQDRGWGAIWRTGSAVDDHNVHDLFGLTKNERLLGWLYVGTLDDHGSITPRPLRDPQTKVSAFLASTPLLRHL